MKILVQKSRQSKLHSQFGRKKSRRAKLTKRKMSLGRLLRLRTILGKVFCRNLQHKSYKPPTLEFGSRIISFVLLFYCHKKLTFFENNVWIYQQVTKRSAQNLNCRACPGVEPETSRTQNENHAPRPSGQACLSTL